MAGNSPCSTGPPDNPCRTILPLCVATAVAIVCVSATIQMKPDGGKRWTSPAELRPELVD